VLDDRQYRSPEVCSKPGHGGSNVVNLRSCTDLRDPSRTMLGQEQEEWLAQGLATSRARWNILAQQTLMAQNTYQPIVTPEDGRFWTDGWDGYPVARRRLLDTLASSGAANPLVLSGDVHTFFATELRADFNRPVSAQNPVLATELCGTSVTSNSRPQEQTLQYLKRNPHIRYGRSDKRGYMMVEITARATTARFMGLDDVHNAQSGASTLASFGVADGQPWLEQLG
jgi:alkaline phosphatase D